MRMIGNTRSSILQAVRVVCSTKSHVFVQVKIPYLTNRISSSQKKDFVEVFQTVMKVHSDLIGVKLLQGQAIFRSRSVSTTSDSREPRESSSSTPDPEGATHAPHPPHPRTIKGYLKKKRIQSMISFFFFVPMNE